ncbi:hypothetical protein BH18ACT10_BH18ACT10_06050 [soil metagenome]
MQIFHTDMGMRCRITVTGIPVFGGEVRPEVREVTTRY